MTHLKTVLSSLLLATLLTLPTFAQFGGMTTGGGADVVIHAPPPVKVGKELRLNAFRMEIQPPAFYLNMGTQYRFGPYPMVTGTAISNQMLNFIFHLSAEKDLFKLQDKKGAMMGPFSNSNRTTFAIGNTQMQFLHAAPTITITLKHPDRIGQMPTIGIAPLTQQSVQALYDLRAKVAGIVNRVNVDKADREVIGVPTIHNPYTGNTSKPILVVSARDKQNADRSGEISSIAFLEKFYGQYCTVRAQAMSGQQTYQLGVQVPGDYLLLVLQKVKPPANAAKGSASPTAIWWTTFTFDGRSSFTGTLAPENATFWKNAFLFE
jgi:hypothetical protein